jgi:predicted glutamine amidotransferase
MCRIIAFVGGGSADLPNLFRAFREGSNCDPYVKNAFGPQYTCHPHGWGLALYDGNGLHHVRSSKPIGEEDVSLPSLKGQNMHAIFHSRLASNPALNLPICSHPFIAATDREVLLLAHNGAVEVDDLATSHIVDSEWALEVIVKAGGINEALPHLKERTKLNSALNLVIMAIPRDNNLPPALHCLNFYKTNDPARVAYYKMYTGDYGGGKVFMSSTFTDLAIKGLTNVQIAPFGEVFSLTLQISAGQVQTRLENSVLNNT